MLKWNYIIYRWSWGNRDMCNSQENQLKECATNNTFYRLKFSFAGGLPDPEVDIFFIVPTLVRIALPERKDIITASKYVRNVDGRVLGCRGFVRNRNK